jgi:hypothetical protein
MELPESKPAWMSPEDWKLLEFTPAIYVFNAEESKLYRDLQICPAIFGEPEE